MAICTYDRVVSLYDEQGERRDKFATKASDPKVLTSYQCCFKVLIYFRTLVFVTFDFYVTSNCSIFIEVTGYLGKECHFPVVIYCILYGYKKQQ